MADGVTLDGPWKMMAAFLLASPDRLHEAVAKATLQNAVALRDGIKAGIVSQAPGGEKFAALHPFTVQQRLAGMSDKHRAKVEKKAADMEAAGGTGHKSLLNHGDLYAAVTYFVIDNGLSATVGVQRKANSDGKDVVDIARILTHGAVITVTDKMRGYLHSQGLHLSPHTTHIIIPPRPFIRPVYNQKLPEMKDRYVRALKSVIKTDGVA